VPQNHIEPVIKLRVGPTEPPIYQGGGVSRRVKDAANGMEWYMEYAGCCHCRLREEGAKTASSNSSAASAVVLLVVLRNCLRLKFIVAVRTVT